MKNKGYYILDVTHNEIGNWIIDMVGNLGYYLQGQYMPPILSKGAISKQMQMDNRMQKTAGAIIACQIKPICIRCLNKGATDKKRKNPEKY